MIYHDFDLTIDDSRGDYYPIRAECHAQAQGELRLDSKIVDAYSKKLDKGETDRELAKTFGKYLYDSIFQGEIGKLYDKSVGYIERNPNEGFRLQLRVRPPELAVIPWEILYDGRHFLATSTKTPLSRYIELGAPINELEAALPIRVLMAIPEGSGLDTKGEETKVVDALKRLGSYVEIEVLDKKVTRKKIRDALNADGKYQVFHFIGHGEYDDEHEGCLVLNSDEDGKRDLIKAEAFSLFFMQYAQMKLVVLNSCEGGKVSSSQPLAGMAPQLIDEEIPAVIAMQYPIKDSVAKLFAEEFYSRLTTGDDKGRVDACVSYARRAICLDYDSTNDFIIPVIFSRSKSGVIFSLEGESKRLHSIQEVHAAESVLKTQEANIQFFSEQAKHASDKDAEKVKEQLAKQIQAAELTRVKIKKWRQRVILQSVAVFLLVLAAFWTGLFGLLNLDDYIERRFVSFMDPYVEKPFSTRVRLIAVKEGDNGPFGTLNPENLQSLITWRKQYAKLISDLAHTQPKPRVIALDILITASASPSEAEVDANTALISAVNEAEKQKVRVIAATELNAPETPLLKTSPAQFGDVNNLRWQKKTNLVREVTLAARSKEVSSSDCNDGEVAVFPSLPLLALIQFGNKPGDPACRDNGSGLTSSWAPPVVACLTEPEDQINLRDSSKTLVREIPVFTDHSSSGMTPMISKIDLAEPTQLDGITQTIEQAYSDSKVLRDPAAYQDGIVVIGVFRAGEPNVKSDIWRVADSESGPRKGMRYGSEIQANIVSNLLTCTYIYPLSITWDLVLILLMVIFGTLLQKLTRDRPSWALPVKIPRTEKIIEVPWLLLIVPVVYFLIAFVAFKESRLLLPANAAYHLIALIIAYYTVGFARTKAGLR